MGCEFCHTVVLNADDLPTTALEQGGDGVPGRTMVLVPIHLGLIFLKGVFFTVPPNFQYQNEKRWATNKRFCSREFSMNKRSSLVEQRFSF